MSFFQRGAEQRFHGNQLAVPHDLCGWSKIEGLPQDIQKIDWAKGGSPNPIRKTLYGHPSS